jgi:nitrate reductase NapE component
MGMRKAKEEEMSSFSSFLISFNLFNILEWGVGGGFGLSNFPSKYD